MFNKLVKSIGRRIPQIKQLLVERDTLKMNVQNLEKENARLFGEILEIKRDAGYQQYQQLRSGKIVVYTAIYGDKDNLKELPVDLEGCNLVCFTDNKHLKSRSFEVRVYPAIHSDPVRSAKIFKVLPHLFLTDFEYSLWIDGSVILKRGDIRTLTDHYLEDYDMALFRHPERDCIYDEAEVCSNRQLDNTEIIREQIKQYKEEGYPVHNGLTENTIMLRRHLAPEVVRVDEDWWAQISRFSRRDQLSFNYVAWKHNFKWATIKGALRDNDYFSVQPHKLT
jgi:hypothetical protein